MAVAEYLSERDKIVGWRFDELERAGYGIFAAAIAARCDIDLHLAVEIVERGCDPKVAAEILL